MAGGRTAKEKKHGQANTSFLILGRIHHLNSPSPPQLDGGTQDKLLQLHKDAPTTYEEITKGFLADVLDLEGRAGILWAELKNGLIWQGNLIHVCDCSPGSLSEGRRV